MDAKSETEKDSTFYAQAAPSLFVPGRKSVIFIE